MPALMSTLWNLHLVYLPRTIIFVVQLLNYMYGFGLVSVWWIYRASAAVLLKLQVREY